MAKSDSLINLRGTFDELTFVKSKAYGDHVRAKRGTRKKAELNGVLKREVKRLISANVPAKILKDAIDPHCGTLKAGRLWQRLLSLFRKQLKDNGVSDFTRIERFEINDEFRFERFLHVEPTIKFLKKESILQVDVSYDGRPRFGRARYIDGYRFTVIGIYPDMKKKTAQTVAVESGILPLSEVASPLSFQLDVPEKTKSYVVAIKIEGSAKGVIRSNHITSGMCIVGSGAL
jgi:hypothetical protein